MKLFLDTEFNCADDEPYGPLISLGIAPERYPEFQAFYAVVPCPNPHPWQAANVMPVLRQEAESVHAARIRLGGYLNDIRHRTQEPPLIVADHPVDLLMFNELLILDNKGGFTHGAYPSLRFELAAHIRGASSLSRVPHNALDDATALRKLYLGEV